MGVTKITSYFKPIPKGQDPLSMPKHCFEDYLHNRAVKAVGIMTAFDACDTLYHHDCVANKSMVRPGKKKVWFYNNCNLMFRNIKNISKEFSDLRSKLASKSESTVKKENCPSKGVMAITPIPAKEDSSNAKLDYH